MPAYHHKLEENKGITLINIGVGPSNAKTLTDHVCVLRPDAMIVVGHYGDYEITKKLAILYWQVPIIATIVFWTIYSQSVTP